MRKYLILLFALTMTLCSQAQNDGSKLWLSQATPAGFCDGIAGEDLGLKFGGDSYKAYYEKNNVSSDIK